MHISRAPRGFWQRKHRIPLFYMPRRFKGAGFSEEQRPPTKSGQPGVGTPKVDRSVACGTGGLERASDGEILRNLLLCALDKLGAQIELIALADPAGRLSCASLQGMGLVLDDVRRSLNKAYCLYDDTELL